MKAYKNNDHEARICILETLTAQINQTLIRLEKKIDDSFFDIKSDTHKHFDKIDKRFEKLENKLDSIDNKFDTKFDNLRKDITEARKENTSHFRTTILTLLTLIGTPLLLESIKLLTKFVHGG